MKSLTNILLKGAMLFALILLGQNLHAQSVSTSASPSDVTAIDILLQPDAAMLKHAEANNARLLKAYPKLRPRCDTQSACLKKTENAVARIHWHRTFGESGKPGHDACCRFRFSRCIALGLQAGRARLVKASQN